MSPLAPQPIDSQQVSPSTARRGRRGGRPALITSVTVAATIALMGSLAACEPSEGNGVASAKAESTAPSASGPAATSKGKNGTEAGDDAKNPKGAGGSEGSGGSDDKSGNADQVATNLLAHLKTTRHGSVVTEVRIVKQFDSYEVTINTSLPAESFTEDSDKAADRIDKGGKLATEAAQWLQDQSTLKISTVNVLDTEKGNAGIEIGADRDGNKDTSDKYGAELKAHLKTVPAGGLVTGVRLSKTFDSYRISVDTTLPAESFSEDSDKAMDRMDKGGKLATEAKQWVENHTSVKVSTITVLDEEKGMAGIESVG